MIDIRTIKSHFPLFAKQPDLVYLDSAATSLKPASVIDAELAYYEEYSANVERGLYPLSERATTEYESARTKIACFIGADPDEIVFTRGTTESLNLLSYSLESSLSPGDEIVVTDTEHHSNFLPWQALAKRKSLTLNILPISTISSLFPRDAITSELSGANRNRIARSSDETSEGSGFACSVAAGATDCAGEVRTGGLRKSEGVSPFRIEDIWRFITPKTKIFSLPFVSNVLGTINPLAEIITQARRINPDIIIIIDAAQAIAHLPIDVRTLDCDFLAFSGHKMFGPTGIGVLYGKRDRLNTLPPYQYGGEMVERASTEESTWKPAPHKFEAGTPPIAQAIALSVAVDFIASIDLDNAREHEKGLLEYATEKLSEHFGNQIRIYGPANIEDRSGVIAFTLDSIHPHDIAHILGESGICIRAGRHCAEPLHDALGISATARLSVSIYNSKEDIDKLVEGIEKAERTLR